MYTVGVLTLCQSLQAIIVNLPGWCGPPQCKPDGSFEEVQCCASTGKCYCVDREGKKVEGTEQNGKPDCEGRTKTIAIVYRVRLVTKKQTSYQIE